MATTLVPSRKVRRRAAMAVVPLAAIAISAGCGGGDSSTGSTAGATADFVPSSAPLYVEVDSDTRSGQWQQMSEVLQRFPAWPGGDVDQVLEEALSDGGVEYDELREVLGESVALAVPRVPGSAAARGLRASAADDTPVLLVAELADGQEDAARQLLSEGGATEQGERGGVTYYANAGEDTYSAVVDGAVVAAQSEESLFASLDAHASGGDAVLSGLDRFDDALSELPEDVFAQAYVSLGDLVRSAAQEEPQLEQLGGLDELGNATLAASLSAELDGLRARGVIVGAEQLEQAATFTPTLLEHAPSNAIAYFGFADLRSSIARTIDSLRESDDEGTQDAIEQIDALSGQIEQLLGVSVSDLAALAEGEHAIVVAPDSASSTQIGGALLLRVTDGAGAQQTLDSLRSRVGALAGTLGTSLPEWRQVELANGVSGWELPASEEASLVYGVDGDLVIIGTSVPLLREVQAPASPLAGSQRYIEGTPEVPEDVTGIVWVDISQAVQLGAANGLFDGQQEVLANLRPLEAISGWSAGGDAPAFEVFFHIPWTLTNP